MSRNNNDLPMLPPWLSESDVTQTGYEAPVQNLPHEEFIPEENAPRRLFARKSDDRDDKKKRKSRRKDKSEVDQHAPESSASWGPPDSAVPHDDAPESYRSGSAPDSGPMPWQRPEPPRADAEPLIPADFRQPPQYFPQPPDPTTAPDAVPPNRGPQDHVQPPNPYNPLGGPPDGAAQPHAGAPVNYPDTSQQPGPVTPPQPFAPQQVPPNAPEHGARPPIPPAPPVPDGADAEMTMRVTRRPDLPPPPDQHSAPTPPPPPDWSQAAAPAPTERTGPPPRLGVPEGFGPETRDGKPDASAVRGAAPAPQDGESSSGTGAPTGVGNPPFGPNSSGTPGESPRPESGRTAPGDGTARPDASQAGSTPGQSPADVVVETGTSQADSSLTRPADAPATGTQGAAPEQSAGGEVPQWLARNPIGQGAGASHTEAATPADTPSQGGNVPGASAAPSAQQWSGRHRLVSDPVAGEGSAAHVPNAAAQNGPASQPGPAVCDPNRPIASDAPYSPAPQYGSGPDAALPVGPGPQGDPSELTAVVGPQGLSQPRIPRPHTGDHPITSPDGNPASNDPRYAPGPQANPRRGDARPHDFTQAPDAQRRGPGQAPGPEGQGGSPSQAPGPDAQGYGSSQVPGPDVHPSRLSGPDGQGRADAQPDQYSQPQQYARPNPYAPGPVNAQAQQYNSVAPNPQAPQYGPGDPQAQGQRYGQVDPQAQGQYGADPRMQGQQYGAAQHAGGQYGQADQYAQQQYQQGQQYPPNGAGPSLEDVPMRRAKKAPGSGWRRAVHHMSGGAINPGMSAEELRLQELVARIRQPVRGDYRIATLSLKGGVGKTTTTMGIGSIFASIRGDRVIAVDANPDFGTLSQRVPLQTRSSVRDLLLDQSIRSYGDVRRHTSQATSRLEVLASERDPAASESFSEDEYRQVLRVLQRFYNIILTDCGTGLMHSAMAGVLDLAHSLVLISSSAIDGARSAAATLDWLSLHGHDHLVRNAVVVINLPREGSPNVAIQHLREYFLARCRAVHIIPYDPHLAEGAEIDLARLHKNTKRALVELAATVADDFATDHRRFGGY